MSRPLLASAPLLLLAPAAPAQQYVVSTFAGGAAPPTPSVATADSIPPATALTIDAAGNVIFAALDCIFQLNRASMLTRIGGSPNGGFAGDGGPVASARFGIIDSLAFDAAGNLYIADNDNHRVRKVSPSGIVATVAGSGDYGFLPAGNGDPAVKAPLWSPDAVLPDRSGNLYIAERSSGAVRRVSPDGLISTVFTGTPSNSVGGGPTMFLAFDASGNLFVSDFNHNFIRKVSPAGVVTTVIGDSPAGFSGDGGPASAARINGPAAMVFDSAGNLYFADTRNYRVRKISRDGIVTTVAGGGDVLPGNSVKATQAILSPFVLAIDAQDNLYLAGSWIEKISPDGSITILGGNGLYSYGGDGGPAATAQLQGPEDVAADSAGNVFIADTDNQRIRRVDTKGVITTFAGNGTCGFSGDGGPALNASICFPADVSTDRAGNVYIADSHNNRVRKITPAGIISTLAGNGSEGYSGDGGPASKASLDYPLKVAADAFGNVFIADYGNDVIRKVSKDGVISTVAGTGVFGFSGDGGPAVAAQLYVPRSVAVDCAGNLFIVDAANCRIRKVAPDGTITTFAGSGSTDPLAYPGDGALAVTAPLYAPMGISVDAADNLFICDALGEIFEVSPNGIIRRITGPPVMPFTVAQDGTPIGGTILGSAFGLTVDSAGRLYVANGSSVRLLQPVDRSILIGSVVDAASEQPSPLSPGKIVVIYGVGMGPAQLAVNHAFNGVYSTQLAETGVFFNGIPAPLLYASATQVSAVVPYGVSGTATQVVVKYQSAASDPFSVPLAASAPSLFSANGTGSGEAAAVNPNGSLNDAAHPVPAGSYISLYATGEGATNAPADGELVPLAPPFPQPQLPVRVSVAGQSATVLYAGAAPGEVAGLMQIVVRIPSTVPAGGYVPVVVQVGDASTVSGAVWIAVLN